LEDTAFAASIVGNGFEFVEQAAAPTKTIVQSFILTSQGAVKASAHMEQVFGAQPHPAAAQWHAAPVPQKSGGEVVVHCIVQKNEFIWGIVGSLPSEEQMVAVVLVWQSSSFWQNLPTPRLFPTSPGWPQIEKKASTPVLASTCLAELLPHATRKRTRRMSHRDMVGDASTMDG
jgi:hypothetical protein